MSIEECPIMYISIYTIIEMILHVISFFKGTNTSCETNSYWNSIIQFYHEAKWLGILRLRTDSFVGKRGEIQALKSMAKFTVALTEAHFALGVLQLISMAGRSSLWFTLIPLCATCNPLAKRLLLVNSQLHYPYYNFK